MRQVPGSNSREPQHPAGRRALAGLHGGLESKGWLDAGRAASASFVALLVAGAVLAVAGKLYAPSVGAGADRWHVLAAIVLLGLVCVGTPVTVDGLVLWTLPLGALAAVGATIFWATARVLARRPETAGRPAAQAGLAGARTAIPFALLTGAAALAFRLDAGLRVEAPAGAAAALAALWGALFGALGGVHAAGRLGAAVPARDDAALAGPSVRRGFQAGAAMALLVVGAGAIGATGWLLVRLVAGLAAGGSGAGAAVASLVAFVAFLPNAAVGVAALAVGASLEAGALAAGGAAPVELSLLDGTLPWYLSPLLAVPPVACFFTGAAARRKRGVAASGPVVVGVAALTFAALLSAGAGVAGVRLAGSTAAVGVSVAADVGSTAALALVWGAVLGGAGWLVGAGPPDLPGARGSSDRGDRGLRPPG